MGATQDDSTKNGFVSREFFISKSQAGSSPWLELFWAGAQACQRKRADVPSQQVPRRRPPAPLILYRTLWCLDSRPTAEVERPAESFVFPEILGFPGPGMMIAHDVADLVKTCEEAGESFRSGDEDPLPSEI